MNEEDLVFYLHQKGYTFFNIPRLTYSEIIALVNAESRKNQKEERELKKAKAKSKRKW